MVAVTSTPVFSHPTLEPSLVDMVTTGGISTVTVILEEIAEQASELTVPDAVNARSYTITSTTSLFKNK